MSKKKTRKKPGPKKIQVDWAEVEKLAAIHCTHSEIAEFTGISEDTLSRRCKEDHKMQFADYLAKKRGVGRISLRRKQFQTAMSGNTTMQIWLGKQWLGQAEKTESSLTVNNLHDALAAVIDGDKD